jgi:phospholipid/cholesterol/gamma-HCH transport system permease protein
MPADPGIALRVEEAANVLSLTGSWRLASLPAISDALRALPLRGELPCVLDGSGLQELDTAAGFTLLRQLATLGVDEPAVTLRAFAGRHARLLALVRAAMKAPAVAAPSTHRGLVGRVGAATVGAWRLVKDHAAFVGAVVLDALPALRRPRSFRFKEAVSHLEAAGLEALPIVTLVTFLIGVVFAYLLGVQAQRFGATIFVVDGMGFAVCRELSPLLVAVVVAGRSGAAFTAQLGTMKVQEEIDAIQTLGLSPIRVLVVPRLVALVVALPLLVFVGDVAGLLGGALVGSWQLGISPRTFVTRLHAVLPFGSFAFGVAKAPVFAATVAMIACRMGMRVARDARSVGENTTSTVVQSIVWVIVLDAFFAVAFQRLGV